MKPFPHQLDGAKFLASRQAALLADDPRCGKTGAAVMAADLVLAIRILVVTTASGRAVWRRGIGDWSVFRRDIHVLTDAPRPGQASAGVVIVGWPSVANPKLRAWLLAQEWDVAILDESHYAKNIEAKRTAAVYGEIIEDGKIRVAKGSAIRGASRVWCLTGTPIPNAPNDLYPMLRALRSDVLIGAGDAPDVSSYQDFLHRYCVVRMKKISNFRKIPVVMGGRNLEELRARIGDFMLRRTQQDVGIRAPIYDTLPLTVSAKVRQQVENGVDKAAVLAAAEAGNTKSLDMHLGPIRRLTGEIKAAALVEALKEEFECGLDKVVLMAWHHETMRILRDGLAEFGVVGIDGSTPDQKRAEAEAKFRDDPTVRVFVGQITAAGEAIDLSAAASLIFVETSFTPKDMKQASLRITNHTQKRQALVRVAVLEGSIDEAFETILLRKWSAIREVISQ